MTRPEGLKLLLLFPYAPIKVNPPPLPIWEKQKHRQDKNQCVALKTVPVCRVVGEICFFSI